MFGRTELSSLLDTSAISTVQNGGKKNELASVSKIIKKAAFAPKIDLSKQTQIYRRRKQRPASDTGSKPNADVKLFESDSEEEDKADQGQKNLENKVQETVLLDQLQLKKETILREAKETEDEAIRLDPVKLQALQRREEDIDEEVATARRRRLLLRQRQNHSSSSSEDEADTDNLLESRQRDLKPGPIEQAKLNQQNTQVANISQDAKVISQNDFHSDSKERSAVNSSNDGLQETSESSSEEESPSDDESTDDDTPRLKFVPKAQRKTILTEEQIQMQLKEAEMREKKKKDVLAKQTKQFVAEQMESRKAAELQRLKQEDEALIFAREGMPDDTDGIDEEKEYAEWKEREIARLKRDLEEQHRFEFEQAEIERRRNLTEEERMKEDEELIKQGKKKGYESEKGKMQFMQKYYHKGAFYIDESSIKKAQPEAKKKLDPRLKDYTAAVERDRKDVELLPKVMQRRGLDFGKRGGTKWTHLVNEDTTNFKESLWAEGEKERKNRKGKK